VSWDPDSLTPEKLHRYRQAAESAWGDDTRSEEYIPHPNPAAGQCFVTSRWLTKHEGGDVGTKDGHYFWVSPDRSHVADITGDRGEHPGPVKFKRADHPAYKGFRIAGPAAPDADRRAQLFAQRADHALHHGTKVSLDLMGPTYIGEDDDLDQRKFNESPFPMLHDDPTYEPEPQAKYNFVWVDGKLQMAPHDDHEQLLHQAGATGDEDGPTAVGYADIVNGHVTWRVASNVGLQSLRDVLLHYSKQIGWKFDGLVGIDGKSLVPGLGTITSYYWRENGDDVQIAKTPFKVAREIQVTGNVAYSDVIHPGLVEWAGDMGLKLAEFPGGGNMLDHMRVREDLEMYNNGDPKFQPGNVPAEFDLPKGPFVCDTCGAKPDTFDAYKLHMDGHQPKEDVVEDGHFPGLPLDDEPLGFGHNPKGIAGEATASVHPFIMELASTHEARRMPEFDERASWMGYDAPGNRIYGAYANGRIQGYAVLAGEYVLDAQGPTEAQRALWEHVAAGKGKEPKDMIEAAVPFVYDIPSDKLHIGYAGTSTHDVPGKISPGGIVEGYYEPGGKVTLQTYSTHPFSIRHLMDLWYHTAPQMEVTSLEQLGKDGKSKKLATADDGQAVGPYIQGLLQSDVAASTAYKALRDAGGKVYAVGGAPRDALQGKIPNDIDLMVSGIAQPDVEHILNKLPGNATFAGKNYGVFHYHHGGDTVEIALPRSDDYGDGGRRGDGKVTVDPDLPIADDLRRRDFTANATAVDLDTGELVDPHGGADDIKRGVLRTTHPGSFREDPSRLIRALTMYGRFGLAPDEQTRHEMEANGHLLRGESPDLLNKTFTKTLKSDNPAAAVRLAHDTGLLSHLLPEVDNNWDYDQNNSHHKHSLGEHLLQVLDNTSRLTTDPDVRFAALMHDVGKPGSAWTDPSTGESHYYQSPNGEGGNHEDVGSQMTEDRLRKGFNLQRSRINRITHLISNHMFSPFTTPKGARRFVQKVGDENADDLLNLREADQTGKGQSSAEVAARTSADSMRGLVNDARVSGETTGMNALSINGNDLLGMGMKPGPAVGQVLQSLQSEVVDDPSKNDPATLKGLAQQYIDAQPQPT
jgi:tRNA nucleotidyltransferase (CCA-adding enzyme)